MSSNWLKPNIKDPKQIRQMDDGQFANPPVFMEYGDFKNAAGLGKTGRSKNLSLQKTSETLKGKPSVSR
jgi:hypothetical protein